MTTVYGIVAAAALLMVGGYFLVDRKRDRWLLLLFLSVAVCDAGYFLLSASATLPAALWANRLAYLGNAFLPFFMLMMILNLLSLPYPKRLPGILIAVNTVVLLIAASGGFLPIYYRSVSLDFIDGAAVLVKEYGPLHLLYKVFLLAYFAAMAWIIAYAARRKTVVSTKHAVFLAFVVIGNIAMWLVENMLHAGFEFLSISYIITEGLILFLSGILQDYGIPASAAPLPETPELPQTEEVIKAFTPEQTDRIFSGWSVIKTLSQREQEVLRLILQNTKRKDIATELFVTESTIKKHTSGIYKKLEISCRAELFEKAKFHAE